MGCEDARLGKTRRFEARLEDGDEERLPRLPMLVCLIFTLDYTQFIINAVPVSRGTCFRALARAMRNSRRRRTRIEPLEWRTQCEGKSLKARKYCIVRRRQSRQSKSELRRASHFNILRERCCLFKCGPCYRTSRAFGAHSSRLMPRSLSSTLASERALLYWLPLSSFSSLHVSSRARSRWHEERKQCRYNNISSERLCRTTSLHCDAQ